MSSVIFISGTPCVGKTTVAEKLSSKLDDCELIKINDLAISNNLVLGEEPEKGYKVIDIDALDELLSKKLDESTSKFVIVEGHLTHLLSNPDFVVILRVNPSVLKSRLSDRNYSDNKIQENLEAEALAVCTCETYELHEDKVNEIDVTSLDIDSIVSDIEKILLNNEKFPVGEIDFMDYFL